MGCFAVRRGQALRRSDVNYNLLTDEVNRRLAHPRFDLAPISSLEVLLQYGCSQRATEEPVGYPMLRMNNLQADGWHLDDLKYAELTAKEFKNWRLERGDIVFNRTNSKELVGKCEVFDEPGDWIFASYLMRLRVDREQAIPEFVTAFLNTRAGRVQIDRESRQIIGMSNINAEEIRTLRIPLPKRDKQRELLAILDGTRVRRKKMIADADALLADLDGFVLDQLGLILPPPDESPSYAIRLSEVRGGRCDTLFHAPRLRRTVAILQQSPLRIESLGTLSPDLAGGATPKRGDRDLYATEGIRFLRIMNIAPFEVRLEDVKYIAPRVHEGDLSRSQLREDDVLMTITGRVGTTAVVPPEALPANINQHIVRIRLVDGTVLPEYLAAYLNCSFGLMLTNRGVTGGTRVAVDYGAVRGLQIPIPSPKVQAEIAAEVARRRANSRRLRAEADKLWEQAKTEFEISLLGR